MKGLNYKEYLSKITGSLNNKNKDEKRDPQKVWDTMLLGTVAIFIGILGFDYFVYTSVDDQTDVEVTDPVDFDSVSQEALSEMITLYEEKEARLERLLNDRPKLLDPLSEPQDEGLKGENNDAGDEDDKGGGEASQGDIIINFGGQPAN